MTNYVKTTNFTAKDTLPPGDAGKIVKGFDFDYEYDNIATAIATKADVYSPTLTGVPTAPTAAAATSTTQLATTAFVGTAVTNERSATATLTNKTLTSPTINGGAVTGITDLTVADGGTGASTAADARTNLGLVIGTDVAPVASPAFTGTPTAPTAAEDDNTTQLATTEFVTTAVTNATGSLGTLATQDSDNVTITGGTIAASFTGDLTGNADTATLAAEATTALDAIGVGQTWQDMAASRALNTDYTNDTGRPIQVSVAAYYTHGSHPTAAVDSVQVARFGNYSCCGVPVHFDATFTFIVPVGSTYRLNGSGTLLNWAELR